jgi:hypothetical protein
VAFLGSTSSGLIQIGPRPLASLCIESTDTRHIVQGILNIASIGMTGKVIFRYPAKKVRWKLEFATRQKDMGNPARPIFGPVTEDIIKDSNTSRSCLNLVLNGTANGIVRV